MRSKSLSLIALAVASVVAAGSSLAQQPIRIGASIAISGRDAVQGGYVREGYLLCQKHVNEKGGVLGRSMEFVIRDDGLYYTAQLVLMGAEFTNVYACRWGSKREEAERKRSGGKSADVKPAHAA